MKTVIQIHDFRLRQGDVKICVPIVAKSLHDIEQQCKLIKELPCDAVEIRIDYLSCLKEDHIQCVFQTAREMLTKNILLATFRSLEEGGQRTCGDEEYLQIYTYIIQHKLCDMLDIEASRPVQIIQELQKKATEAQIITVLSSHDFTGVKDNERLMQQFRSMAALHPDVVKIAVMPHAVEDAIRFMNVVKKMNPQITQPIIAMAMGELGRQSRIEGEKFGSCMTFACAQTASAPGQLPCREMKNLLDEVHTQIKKEKMERKDETCLKYSKKQN